MNELLDIADKLNDKYDTYGSGKHWEIVKAEKTENGWNLTVQPTETEEEKDGGAQNESNE